MIKSRLLYYSALLLLLVLAVLPCELIGHHPELFDIIIINGRVMDGTGNPWFYADIGIRDKRIVAIGRLKNTLKADRIVDAKGKMVVPGFIDIHSHGYDAVKSKNAWKDQNEGRFAAPNFVSQGITMTITGQCGYGPVDIKKQREALVTHGIGPNAGLMVGHNAIRRRVMNNDYKRSALPEEIEKMKNLLRQAMDDGALGLSSGLEYVPAIWSDTEELVALNEVIVPYGGVFIAHERASGKDPMWFIPSQHEPGQPSMIDNIVEIIEVSERTGVTAVATHLKIRGAHYWGASGAVIRLMNAARARGVNVWGDCYPYNTTGSDGSTVLIPAWTLSTDRSAQRSARDPRAGLKKILADPEKAVAMKGDIKHEIARRGSPENIIVMDYPDKNFIGKSLAELSSQNGISPVELAIKMQLEGFQERRGGVRLRGYSLSEIDVEAFMQQNWCATCTDAFINLPTDGPVHARHYGTFPRKIRHYVLELGLISLEHAIRSMTSLPAQILGLRDRGMLREGFYADIVIFDLNKIRDTATQFDPHQYAEGIDYVMVNGEWVVDAGELTWKLPGMIITR